MANTPPEQVTPPLDTLPPPAVTTRAPMPGGSTPNPSPPEPAPDPRFATSPSRRIGRGRTLPRSIPDQPQSLAERLQSVEHRLDDFERRLGALERRLQQLPGSGSVSGLSPARDGSSTDLAPPVSRHATPGARSADTLDAISTIPPGPASADSARPRPQLGSFLGQPARELRIWAELSLAHRAIRRSNKAYRSARVWFRLCALARKSLIDRDDQAMILHSRSGGTIMERGRVMSQHSAPHDHSNPRGICS